jgi:hypothetical protein
VRLIDATSDGDPEPVVQRLRHLARHGDVPTADEYRGHGADLGIESGGDAPFDATQIRLGCPLDLSPQLVERVYRPYEEQRREDVRAVQDGERETADVETKQ